MDRRKMNYQLREGLDEDMEKLNGAKALMLLPAGEGRNEGESGRGPPVSGAAAAEGEGAEELSREGSAAAGDGGFMIHSNQEGHGACRHIWEDAHPFHQPVFWSARGACREQSVPLVRGKGGSRNRFSRWQLRELELVFQHTQYIGAGVRKRLAESLGVREATVQNWFKKKRAQYRKYHNS